jgi:hypothetical protein
MALPKVYTKLLLDSVPPWLTRPIADRLLRSFGDEIDGIVTRVVYAVRQRFPSDIDDSSLAMIGRERRIRRGPGEDADTYATRLRAWWDMHRIRGNAYALLWNLHHFFLNWLPGRKDVVDHSGKRTWIDAAGTITRDSITWDADGSNEWAQVWVFFYTPTLIPLGTALLVTTWNELITSLGGDAITVGYSISPSALGGDAITVGYSISPSALTEAEEEVFRAIPREWSAAHVKRTHVVLLPGEACLVGYPPRLVGDPPVTVTPADAPVFLTIDGGV